MRAQLIKFVIETRNPDTGYWKDWMPIVPKYTCVRRSVTKRFLCWTWQKRTRVITNYTAAYTAARKRAIYQAKAARRRHHDVRIQAYVFRDHYRTNYTIWENGKFLDC